MRMKKDILKENVGIILDEGSTSVTMAYKGLSSHIDFDQLPEPAERFQVKDVIGEGTYGEVYSAFDKQEGNWVALKILENIPDNLEEIEEEYLILRDLCMHPNIPMFYGLFLKRATCIEEDQLWFVMELCAGGSVTDLVQGLNKRNEKMPEMQIAYILKETMQAVMFLHANHCMHRDIKGHNILLTEQAHIKLLDFGVSSHLSSTMGRKNTSVGTPYWMAPEVIACEQQLDYSYDVRCDVWSVGITAIELADGDPPLSDIHPMRALFQIPRNPPPKLKNPGNWSVTFNNFVSECLIKDFEQRPVIHEMLEHPFIKQLSNCIDLIRSQLQEEMRRQKKLGPVKYTPEVTTKHGKLKSNRKSKLQVMYVDDLASLDNITEDIVVEQLYRRFVQGQIYTYIGDILIALNPFQDLGIYSEQESNNYRNQSRSDNPPHIFAVADAAYHALLHHKQNQCIVISGESGAGKTEGANLLLRQLVGFGKAPNRNLENQILQVNPIMEAFGNAKTGINDNSSRFGKFLELTFTKTGKVTGAKVSVYLLEQSRVVFQSPGEQNFHIFYYLYDGLESRHRLHEYYLDGDKKFKHRYLRGYCAEKQSIKNNCQRFQNVLEGFQLLGFTGEEVDTVWRILAAILNLGDLAFLGDEAADNTDSSLITNPEIIIQVANLLGVHPQDLIRALTTNSVVTRGESIQRHNTLDEAAGARDSMAKALYGRLFDWLVNRINRLLSFGRHAYGEAFGVGLLDIFGFENFKNNSFEQLCINIANEQIQYYFNQHIFSWEQQEYMSESINVGIVEFADNRPVLDMFLAKPMGLLSLLDEESRFPKATDTSLIEKFHNNIRSRYYHKPKSNDLNFAIDHYAGKVAYNVKNFLEKNRNFLPPEVIQLLRQSRYDIIRNQFQSPLTRTGHLYQGTPQNSPRSTPDFIMEENFLSNKVQTQGLASQTRAQQTVATYFRFSLMDLLQKMVGGIPHFIRCIKPNDKKSQSHFDRYKVALQLKYTGVLETIRIRQQGFSHRIPFATFLKQYSFLAFGFNERVLATKENCRLLLIRLKMDEWALGKTKVFLKYYHVEYLSKLYEKHMRSIVVIQAYVRGWLSRIRYKRRKRVLSNSVLTMQKYARGWLARKQLAEIKCSLLAEQLAKSAIMVPLPHKQMMQLEVASAAKAIPVKKHGHKRRAPSPPRIANLDAKPSEDEAARTLQRFFRKWKAKRSFFQQLQKMNILKSQPAKQVNQEKDKLPYSNIQKVPPGFKIPRGVELTKYIYNGDHSPNRSSQMKNDGNVMLSYYDEIQKRMNKDPLLNLQDYRQHLKDGVIPQYHYNLEKDAKVWSNLVKQEFQKRGNREKIVAHNRPSTPAKNVAVKKENRHRQGLEGAQGKPVAKGNVRGHKQDHVPLSDKDDELLRLFHKPHNNGRLNGSHEPRQTRNAISVDIGQDDSVGPYDFRRILRKTNHAPTESLRRRKGLPERDSSVTRHS